MSSLWILISFLLFSNVTQATTISKSVTYTTPTSIPDDLIITDGTTGDDSVIIFYTALHGCEQAFYWNIYYQSSQS